MILSYLKYLFSFLTGYTLETTSGEVNPYLEVVCVNGKIMLNAASVTYSEKGSCRVFEKSFSCLHFENKSFDKVLILGFGTGGAASLLLEKYHMHSRITGVELDHRVVELGYKYFDLSRLENVEIVYADACQHMKTNCEKYDLILVDVFVDNRVPESCESADFLHNLKTSLNEGGMIVFNKFSNDAETSSSAKRLISRFQREFMNTEIQRFHSNGTNYILVSQK